MQHYAEAEPFAAYQRPRTVNPSCGQFTPQPGVTRVAARNFQATLVSAYNLKPQFKQENRYGNRPRY